jgi:sigma-B regulation protein RsbU (phosphoserine phosphatase)
METVVTIPSTEHARHQLLERRERLEAVIPQAPDAQALARLLEEVDAALGRIERGSFGVCDVCDGTVEPDRLASDPLLHTCLTCLSAAERRALEHDLDLAGHVQRTLLPPAALRVDGWEAAYKYQPAGLASGDYIDLVPLDSGELVFLIGDVSGKGVAASLLMSHLHATVRSLIAMRLPFGELMERANRIFYDSVSGDQYATLLSGKAGPDGLVELSNAGHCPPIVLRGSNAFTLPPTSVPVGMFANPPFPTTRLTLGVGDTLLLYTDGVTEAADAAGREFGRERLVAAASRRDGGPVTDAVASAVDELDRFRGITPRTDDLTLFALRRSA